MAIKTAEARWKGSLKEGQGMVTLGSGLFKADYSYPSRFKEGTGTNPEELLGAALAACYAMALSAELTKQQHTFKSIRATANVNLNQENNGYKISPIELNVELESEDKNQAALQKCCETAKANCPVAKLYAGTTIALSVQFK